MMQQSIIDFLNSQQVATVCFREPDGLPYCFSCFYSFDAEEGLLLFKSGTESHHANLLVAHAGVAGTILPGKINPLAVQGIQFQGMILTGEEEFISRVSRRYYIRFPLARAMPGRLYFLRLIRVKLTDNTLGFGHKISWQLQESMTQPETT